VNTLASRLLTSATLLIWGAVLAFFFVSNRIASYLHPAFHGWVLVSGLVLIALAVGSFVFCEGEGCGTCCEQPGWKTFLVAVALTVPLLLATVISPSEFGATAVMNRGIIDNLDEIPAYAPPLEPPLPQADGSIGEGTMMDPALYLAKNPAGQIKAETIDLLYAAAEPTMREDFENKEVEVIGQFVPARTGNPSGDRFNLVRMFVMCCAADARPVGIAVQSRQTFPEMSWLKITGKVTFPIEAGRRSAVIIADSIEETDPPEESFIY